MYSDRDFHFYDFLEHFNPLREMRENSTTRTCLRSKYNEKVLKEDKQRTPQTQNHEYYQYLSQ